MTQANSQHPLGPIAFAGGGTGGHVVPGMHLLERLAQRGTPPTDVLWFGAGRPIEDRVLAEADKWLAGVHLTRVVMRLEPPGGGAPSLWRLLRRTLPSVLTARRALTAHRSRAVIGFGGYTTLPVALAARSLGVPLLMVEINSVAGRATRALSPLARHVFHAWTATMPKNPGERHVHTGPPLAEAFAAAAPTDAERRVARSELGFDPQEPLILVLGGSQGAASLNAFLQEHAAGFAAAGAQVLHQAGPGRTGEGAADSARYRCVEYLDDMALALTGATLVLSRGGASTLAEIAARGCPAFVVPYPHHADRHQERNAQWLGEGVRVLDESELSAALVGRLATLAGPVGDSERAAMSKALAGVIPKNASEVMSQVLDELCRVAQS